MPQKSVLRTLLALIAWVFLQNFNDLSQNSHENAIRGYAPSYKIKRVVLDAGHGGKDPGCIGVGKNYEKHNALAIVLALGEKISAEFPDIDVIYTRKEDVFVELNERAAIANRNNADLFISVHCNSMSVASASGTETYVMGLHTAKHNLEVAKRENASIYLEENYQKNYEGYDPDSPEAHIIGSVWQSAYLEQSILLAEKVQHYAKKIAKRDSRGVKQAGFLVLRETAMPSVLIETGYLTNEDEDTYLASDDGRGDMAEAIFLAFKGYKNQMENPEPAPKSNPPKQVKNTPKSTPATNKPPAQKPTTTPVTTPSNKPTANQAVKGNAAEKKTWRIELVIALQRQNVNAGQLSLLSDVQEEKIDQQYHYFTGNFATRADAERLLPEMRNLGFKTAKVVQK
jgi:N-acetylmuramoyl-L-alanine amidase